MKNARDVFILGSTHLSYHVREEKFKEKNCMHPNVNSLIYSGFLIHNGFDYIITQMRLMLVK